MYVSRKLIIDARSEDEVAAVLSHEIGHIYTKQFAADLTRQLKTMMGVTALGGREDLEDKLQLLLNAPWKDAAGESEEEEEKDELLADRVGLYALTKAGYAPRALSENLDRIASNKGHTGNFLTDMLGGTSLISMRVRVARKVADSVPEACKQVAPGSSTEFKVFQQAVRDAPIHPLIEPTSGLNSIVLDPPMRSQLQQIRFSPDGNLVLAQDDSSIHVLSRSPLKRLFSIDARGALQARFTPDSAQVVFHYPTMRVERWNVASSTRVDFSELVDYDGCLQTSLAPDGRTFVCLSEANESVWLKLSDVSSGKVYYEDKRFYSSSLSGSNDIIVRRGAGKRVGTVAYSQDGRTMLIVVGARAIAFDLVERRPISLGNNLSRMADGRVAFVDSSKVLFQCKDDFTMCETSFPDGMPLNSFKVGYQWVDSVAHGAHVLIGPFKDNPAALVDPATGIASVEFKMDSLDLYDNTVASENANGGVSLSELGSQKVDSVELPVSPMPGVEAASFSPDGRFLAYSGKTRSSIWDLTTQRRVALMRPFRAVRFDDQDQMFAQYPGSHQRPGQNFHIDLKTGKAVETAKYAIDQFQRGEVLVTFVPDKSGDASSNADLQVADLTNGTKLWSKHFPHETPLVSQDEDGTLVLLMEVNGDTGLTEMKHLGDKLAKSSDWKSVWAPQGLLTEVIDSRTGEIRRAIQTPQQSSYREDGRWVAVYGDYAVVHGSLNNSTIYRISDGKRQGAFYGRAIAGDGKMGLIAATNRDQEVTIYDAMNGKGLKQVTVDQVPCAARFIKEKNALLVLTTSQRVYSIDLPTPTSPGTARAN